MDRCPQCGATLRTPLLCESCFALLEPARAPTPFEALGLAPAYAVDGNALRSRVLELSRRLHPDYFGNADERTRELAQRSTAELNAAFQTLADDFRRADWLVKALGGPQEDQERSMPAEFLQEVLEWNEAIEEARGASGKDSLDGLGARLSSERAGLMRSVDARLTPLPDRGSGALVEVRKLLNAVRYLDRALREITELRLAQAARPR